MKFPEFRKDLGKPYLLEAIRDSFGAIRAGRQDREHELRDCLMNGLAGFVLKDRWLFDFGPDGRSRLGSKGNLESLFGVAEVRSSREMLRRLDRLDSSLLRPTFNLLHSRIRRSGMLDDYTLLGDHHLLSLASTEYPTSPSSVCKCCTRGNSRYGSDYFCHRMLIGMICHPDHRQAFPLMPEHIRFGDPGTRSEAEGAAARRCIDNARSEYPRLPLIVLQDGRSKDAAYIRHLAKHDLRFILGAREKDLARILQAGESRVRKLDIREEDGSRHQFRILRDIPLDASRRDLRIHAIDHRETRTDRVRKRHGIEERVKIKNFAWITDLPVDEETLMPIMRVKRSRWRIDREILGTIKDLVESPEPDPFEDLVESPEPDPFENHKNLSNVLACLMVLAFLVDQIESRTCPLFRHILERSVVRDVVSLMRSYAMFRPIKDWETLYRALIRQMNPR